MNKADISESIVRRRKELGFTQKELADKLFVSDKTISKWERGGSHPDISLWDDIATALNLTIPELLGIENQKNEDVAEIIVKEAVEIGKTKQKKYKSAIILLLVIVLIIAVFLIQNYINFQNASITENLACRILEEDEESIIFAPIYNEKYGNIIQRTDDLDKLYIIEKTLIHDQEQVQLIESVREQVHGTYTENGFLDITIVYQNKDVNEKGGQTEIAVDKVMDIRIYEPTMGSN